MDGLRDRLGLLVNLGVLRDAEVVHVAHAFPPRYPRENMHIGRTAVAQTTALGKVLLATLPCEEALARVAIAGWRPYTQNSISDETALKAELEGVSLRGFAVDREERHIGIMCVAVPIPYSSHEISGALSVTGRSEQVSGRIEELAAELTAAAKRSRRGSVGPQASLSTCEPCNPDHGDQKEASGEGREQFLVYGYIRRRERLNSDEPSQP